MWKKILYFSYWKCITCSCCLIVKGCGRCFFFFLFFFFQMETDKILKWKRSIPAHVAVYHHLLRIHGVLWKQRQCLCHYFNVWRILHLFSQIASVQNELRKCWSKSFICHYESSWINYGVWISVSIFISFRFQKITKFLNHQEKYLLWPSKAFLYVFIFWYSH